MYIHIEILYFIINEYFRIITLLSFLYILHKSFL